MSAPTITIFPLSEGFVLHTPDDRKIACTTITSLAKALKDYLIAQADRGQMVQFPDRTAVTQARAALSPVTPSAPPASLNPATPAAAVGPTGSLTIDPNQLPDNQRRALVQLAQLWAAGKLDRPTLFENLAHHVPDLDPHAAEILLSEYVADTRSDE